MRVQTKLSEEEVRKTLFEKVDKAAKTNRPWTQIEPTWCELSETRLFSKIIEFKPAGVNRNFNLGIIVDHMNNIYDDEDDFEDYLSPDDLITMKKRRETGQILDNVMSFPPKYNIRPTIQQITDKLNDLYDMNIIESYEADPEIFEQKSDFFLPEGEFSEMIQKLEKKEFEKPPPEAMTRIQELRAQNSRTPAGGPPSRKRRRRGSTDSSSRASTPAQRNRIEHDS